MTKHSLSLHKMFSQMDSFDLLEYSETLSHATHGAGACVEDSILSKEVRIFEFWNRPFCADHAVMFQRVNQ